MRRQSLQIQGHLSASVYYLCLRTLVENPSSLPASRIKIPRGRKQMILSFLFPALRLSSLYPVYSLSLSLPLCLSASPLPRFSLSSLFPSFFLSIPFSISQLSFPTNEKSKLHFEDSSLRDLRGKFISLEASGYFSRGLHSDSKNYFWEWLHQICHGSISAKLARLSLHLSMGLSHSLPHIACSVPDRVYFKTPPFHLISVQMS